MTLFVLIVLVAILGCSVNPALVDSLEILPDGLLEFQPCAPIAYAMEILILMIQMHVTRHLAFVFCASTTQLEISVKCVLRDTMAMLFMPRIAQVILEQYRRTTLLVCVYICLQHVTVIQEAQTPQPVTELLEYVLATQMLLAEDVTNAQTVILAMEAGWAVYLAIVTLKELKAMSVICLVSVCASPV